MERRGVRTERGDANRRIEITNREIRRLRARVIKLDKWIAEEAANTRTPALADVISEILTRQGQSGASRLKAASHALSFLPENRIADMDGLERKVKSMYGRFQSVRDELKPVERRLKTLDEHLARSADFKNCRKFKRRCDELRSLCAAAKKETGLLAERKARKALEAANEYRETHRAELAMFGAAEEYLRGVLRERFDPKKLPPTTKWTEERDAKTAERAALCREYETIKAETRNVEQIRRSVADILRADSSERAPRKARGAEL
jgi:hypothetical protein